MGSINQLRKNLSPLLNRRGLEEILFIQVKKLEAYLIDLNLLQLENNSDIFGRSLGFYTEATEAIAKDQNTVKPKIAGEPFNFQWTGDLFGGFFIGFGNGVAWFFSKDDKAPFLEEEYGDIFGLTKEHLEEAVRDRIAPAFIRQMRLKLKL